MGDEQLISQLGLSCPHHAHIWQSSGALSTSVTWGGSLDALLEKVAWRDTADSRLGGNLFLFQGAFCLLACFGVCFFKLLKHER